LSSRVDRSPVVVENRVFIGSADGRLYALDLKTGREVWRFEAGGAISASPAVGEHCLVVGTEDGAVYCFGEKPRPREEARR
jgi:outer membrane protein assembly factor BamB